MCHGVSLGQGSTYYQGHQSGLLIPSVYATLEYNFASKEPHLLYLLFKQRNAATFVQSVSVSIYSRHAGIIFIYFSLRQGFSTHFLRCGIIIPVRKN